MGKHYNTIRELATDLLCHVDYYETRKENPGPDNIVPSDYPNARSVGISYDRILKVIREHFPKCRTSVECLRWYAVKIRAEDPGYEGRRLCQRRPRARRK